MSNDWKRGVCGCCGDPPSGQSPEDRAQRDEACCACFGACCYSTCCFYCQISQLSGEVNVPDDDDNLSCKEKMNRCYGNCIFPCCFLCGLRTRVREQYGIEGNECSDCVVSWCCPVLALMQTANEIKERKQETVITDQPL